MAMTSELKNKKSHCRDFLFPLTRKRSPKFYDQLQEIEY